MGKKVKGSLGLLWKIYVGVVFAIFAIILYPFFLAVLVRPKWKKLSFKLFILWSWIMRFTCFYYVKKVKNSPLPDGPYIIVSNHSSYLDIFFMYSILPKHPFVFLGKSEILTYPIIKTYFKNLNIPVYRGDRNKAGKSYLLAHKAVQEGWSLVIFPEGGIPDNIVPKMIPFKDGAFKLAKELNIPIVPLTFTNNYHLFSDPTEVLGPARPGIAHLHIHPFIDLETIQNNEVKTLKEMCFKIVEAPIREAYPHLYQS